MSKTIYYVRHGESQANVDGITAGGESNSLLTPKGKDQAKQTGSDLKNKGIELIVCSPLKRTHQTAEIIANQIGYDVKKIVQNADFIERYVGIYSDRPYSEYLKAAKEDNLHESAETAGDMVKRVKHGLKWLKKQKAKTILVVSHGGTSRILRIILNNLPHDHMYKMEALNNAQIFEFELE